MKIAIVHDELIRRGGAEQVALLMHKAFPDAPIYTSCYNPQLTYSEFALCNIKTSWLSRYVKDENTLKKLFFPFGIWAMHSLNLKAYDVIIISTTTGAKFVTTSDKSLIVAFCHYPFRLAWFPEQYSQVVQSKGLKSLAYKLVVSILKKKDYKGAQKINWFITNTPDIKRKIQICYNPKNEVSVIPVSIQCSNFYLTDTPTNDFYLVVTRIESYKKVDVVIRAFNQMPNRKLIIVGKGSQKDMLMKIAGANIEFKEGLSKEQIAKLYANAKAFIFPQEEDFGLTPIEANASGRPVIAYGKGGVTYTTIPYINNSKKATAVYFDEQTPEKIIKAVEICDNLIFDPMFIRQHAEMFDEKNFIENIRKFVYDKYNNRKKQGDIKNIL
ncbi:MAG: glycosyltransferase [Dysgonomonas sp.]